MLPPTLHGLTNKLSLIKMTKLTFIYERPLSKIFCLFFFNIIVCNEKIHIYEGALISNVKENEKFSLILEKKGIKEHYRLSI